MNRYWGDENDEKVGCGGAFNLTGADWNSQWQWGGTLSESGPEDVHSVGFGLRDRTSN